MYISQIYVVGIPPEKSSIAADATYSIGFFVVFKVLRIHAVVDKWVKKRNQCAEFYDVVTNNKTKLLVLSIHDMKSCNEFFSPDHTVVFQ